MRSGVELLIIGLLGTEIALILWKMIVNRRNKEIKENNKLIVEVLMFSESSVLCRNHANTRIPCDKKECPVGHVKRIQWYLQSTKRSLDVCMYIMTCDDLTKAIIEVHRRGVCVRIIMDAGMSENPGCHDQVLRMRRAGIRVRTNQLKPSCLMHHKVAIIDRKIVIFGSTNWTMQAFYGNYDGVVITNAEKCVASYSGEFETMWNNLE